MIFFFELMGATGSSSSLKEYEFSKVFLKFLENLIHMNTY